MATYRKTHQLAVVVFLFVFTSSSLSSARLLNGFLSHDLTATEPTLNLALPVDDDDNNNDVFNKSENDPKQQVLPCDHMVLIKNSHVGIMRSPTQRLTGKYGPMILSMLPKGSPNTPSGPSHGHNDVKN